MIRLLMVEDQAVVSKGMQMRLATETDLSVVARAGNCEQALMLTLVHCPDVVVVDLDLPQVDGIALAQALRGFCRMLPIIFLSMRDDPATIQQAMKAGAAAVVGKFSPVEELFGKIRLVSLKEM